MMLGKKFKNSLRKILIGMLSQKTNVRLCILGGWQSEEDIEKEISCLQSELDKGHLTKKEFDKKVSKEKNTLGLRLIPLYLYPSLPIGITLTSIGGEERVFDGSNISTDVRFGCLAWGIKPKKD